MSAAAALDLVGVLGVVRFFCSRTTWSSMREEGLRARVDLRAGGVFLLTRRVAKRRTSWMHMPRPRTPMATTAATVAGSVMSILSSCIMGLMGDVGGWTRGEGVGAGRRAGRETQKPVGPEPVARVSPGETRPSATSTRRARRGGGGDAHVSRAVGKVWRMRGPRTFRDSTPARRAVSTRASSSLAIAKSEKCKLPQPASRAVEGAREKHAKRAVTSRGRACGCGARGLGAFASFALRRANSRSRRNEMRSSRLGTPPTATRCCPPGCRGVETSPRPPVSHFRRQEPTGDE